MGCYGICVVEWANVLTVQDMNFISYNPPQHEPAPSLPSDLNSIGCEAWIDVSRFAVGEKQLQAVAVNLKVSKDPSGSACAHSSLTKSFALLRKKLRRGSVESQQ